jgi:hypothetical protein
VNLPNYHFRCSAILIPILHLFCCLGNVVVAQQTPNTLAITSAGVESEEDGPFVPAEYRFLPGDYLHFVFQVTGFKVERSGEEKHGRISLRYSVQIIDESGSNLAPEEKRTVQDELAPEDKEWTPKRRAAFLLPSYVSAGTYRVRVVVEDIVGAARASADYPFLMGGHSIRPGSPFGVQNFRFLRSEEDEVGLDIAAYRPGSTIWARFDITGFRAGPQNSVLVDYGVTVLRPDGSVILSQVTAAQQKLAGLSYAPRFVPGQLSFTTTPDLARGGYTLVVVLHDRIGKENAEFRNNFQIE